MRLRGAPTRVWAHPGFGAAGAPQLAGARGRGLGAAPAKSRRLISGSDRPTLGISLPRFVFPHPLSPPRAGFCLARLDFTRQAPFSVPAFLPVAEGRSASATAAAAETEGFLFQAVGVAVWHNFCSPAFNFVISACFISSCCRGRAGRLGKHSGTVATLHV